VTGYPEIPETARAGLCQMALDGQAALLDAFDAIEAGDLPMAVVHLTEATRSLNELNGSIRPLAAIAVTQIQQRLGVEFGSPHAPEGGK